MAKVLFRHIVVAIVTVIAAAAPAFAQSGVLIYCPDQARCVFQKIHAPAVSGQTSVKVLSPSAGADPGQLRGGRSVKMTAIPGLYRDPDSGLLRVFNRSSELGDIVLPSKQPKGVSGPLRWSFDYRENAASKKLTSVTDAHFFALIRDPASATGIVDLLRNEIRAAKPHPLRQPLIAGAVAFMGSSPELKQWTDDLKSITQRSLELFNTGRADPTALETILADGVSASRIYRAILPDAPEEAAEKEVRRAHEQLTNRFAIAGALKAGRVDDAFIQKLDQIGIARWSRADLMKDFGELLRMNAQAHAEKARKLLADGHFPEAVDEARLASARNLCSDGLHSLFSQARVDLVNSRVALALPEYNGKYKGQLEQAVRQMDTGGKPTQEQIEYLRGVIANGEQMDPHYLPLQLKKAEFLESIGELAAAREVVMRIERDLILGRKEAEQWLGLDGRLNTKLLTDRKTAEREYKQHLEAGQFKEALEKALTAVRAEPSNTTMLANAAVAAAILRDGTLTKRLIEAYLQAYPCGDEDKRREELLDLYRRPLTAAANIEIGTKTPNWISGVQYGPGEAYYDPVSGSSNIRVRTTTGTQGTRHTEVDFRWSGFVATAITITAIGKLPSDRRPILELEPTYDMKHLYMSAIGLRATTSGQPRFALRYLNSPDMDPVLAGRFSKNLKTTGWAGNPFFHPFLWDEIYLFELQYDELGRIHKAIPVRPDFSRPRSRFSEELTFEWDGKTKRLLSIAGTSYRRDLFYDKQGRLTSEQIKHPDGKGRIQYTYQGESKRPVKIVCEDNFYDKAKRNVLVVAPSDK